jgi:hypothetical protein
MVTIYQLIISNNPEDTHPQDMIQIRVENLNKMVQEQEMVSTLYLHMKGKRVTKLVIKNILHERTEMGSTDQWEM